MLQILSDLEHLHVFPSFATNELDDPNCIPLAGSPCCMYKMRELALSLTPFLPLKSDP